MPCQKFKESIYTYAELSPEERKILDGHIQQCASCQALLSEVESMTKMVQALSSHQPVPRDNAKLTHQIMAGVERSKSKGSSGFFSLDRFLSIPTLRYSLAAASITIVLSFVAEHNITQNQTYTGNQRQVSEMSSVLNTSQFLKTIETTRLRNASKKQFSISLCLSTNTCEQLSYFKTKKNHEQSH